MKPSCVEVCGYPHNENIENHTNQKAHTAIALMLHLFTSNEQFLHKGFKKGALDT